MSKAKAKRESVKMAKEPSLDKLLQVQDSLKSVRASPVNDTHGVVVCEQVK